MNGANLRVREKRNFICDNFLEKSFYPVRKNAGKTVDLSGKPPVLKKVFPVKEKTLTTADFFSKISKVIVK